MDKEIWKDIKGYENLYQVSNKGQVKSLNWERSGKERILKPGKGDDRYLQVVLSKDGKKKTIRVHQLVAEAFVENPKGEKYIDHLDGNNRNNNAENLKWCSAKQNANNPITALRRKMGLHEYWARYYKQRYDL